MASSSKQAEDHKVYNIEFYQDRIETTVTATEGIVDRWIHETYSVHGGSGGSKFLVGLDTEWRLVPESHDYQVALLQLCVGRRCLLFQFLHLFSSNNNVHDQDDDKISKNNNSDTIPKSLVQFLNDQNITFVGKQVEQDVKLLFAQWGLRVACFKDVSHMAAAKYGDTSHKCKGLKTLAMEFLHKHMDKSKDITQSRWEAEELSHAQVQYACIDAFVSLRLGMLYDQSHTASASLSLS